MQFVSNVTHLVRNFGSLESFRFGFRPFEITQIHKRMRSSE